MNKIFRVLLFLGFIWILSYALATLFFNATSFIGDQIVVIPIQGMITLDGAGSLFTEATSAHDIVNQIDAANADSSVKGIVLEINSPGGTVMGSKVVADAIKNVEKPVVAVITEYGASGAYWIASQADVIVADDLSIVGSIGVLGSYLEFGGLLEDYNVTYQRLVTGKYKDISTPYRPMTGEEEKLIMERLQGIHEYFVSEVAEGRGMGVSDVAALSDGLFYLGKDAVDLGLVDVLGNKDDAINLTKQLAGVSDGSVSEYEKEKPWYETLSEYTSRSFFSLGQGIGSVLVSVNQEPLVFRA